MNDTIENRQEGAGVAESQTPVCPICGRAVQGELFSVAALPDSLRSIIIPNTGTTNDGKVCGRCIELFDRARQQIEAHARVFEQNDFVLPTPLRMDADERFTGRGVTIAFLDSGFYSHPDLTRPKNRILAYHSIFAEEGDETSLETNDVASWHGMMTSVVAAGNGGLAEGFYRGIASESNVVLVKIGRSGRISEDEIQRGLEWILDHAEEHQVRVINISAGGDFEGSYLTTPLSQAVERCVLAGMTVVCAAGNAAQVRGHPVLPPASAPSCIAVGGLNDHNSLDRARRGMYRSSYGPTIDGLQKPEVIAPGIWVAAPILLNTPTAEEAELYSMLDAAADEELRALIASRSGLDKDLDESSSLPIHLVRQLISIKLREGNVISQHYKYVDGTSFAAPIVSSIVACMLEANPPLSPQKIKRMLIDTAERVPGVEVDRQGWGVVSARRAVELALALRGSA
jgi:serine protease AprX